MFSDISTLLTGSIFTQVQAAQVTIDANASSAQAEHVMSGATSVFTSDQIGYKVFVDSTGQCVYSKTTDGGGTWLTPVLVDSVSSCATPVVWYDQWTPGDTGVNIHILTMDITAEKLHYNRLDTSTDTLLLGSSPVDVMINSAQTGTYSAAANKPALTKGTDGTVYITMTDATDSFVVECSSNCNSATGWTETGTNPLDATNDFTLLVPLASGNIMLINRDVSLNDIRYKIWNNTNWSATWGTIDANALENSVYDVGMAIVVDPATNDLYLVYTADTNTLGTNDDLRTAVYSGGSWSATTDVLTDDVRGITQVSIGYDVNTDTVYVAYSVQATAGTASTADVYWVKSTNGMSAWSTETGPVNTTSGDIYAVDLNFSADERMYVSWYEDASRDVLGDTIADIGPITVVSATGAQVSVLRASSSSQYIGGAFVIKENIASRNLTDIEISEQGTIDGASGIGNIELWYDFDTTAPYDCASESYSGNETQFGLTDTNGFSGPNGISHFNDVVTISPTQTVCVYPVVDILKDANDATTIDITIQDPTTDVVVTGGVTPIPTSSIVLSGSTTVYDDDLTQTHYHWRNDDGTEASATSATGGNEDTPINALQTGNPQRLRIGVSNKGSTTTLPTTLRLEWGVAAPNCTSVSTWTDVNATDDDWNMSPTANLTEGANTTDVAVATGGVTDENVSFLSTNTGVRDTTSETGSLQINSTEFTALEYSIVASSTATEGDTYCFRVTNQGEPISSYTNYPQVTISADVTVASVGTQVVSADIPTSNFYIGGSFSIAENIGSRNVTDITIAENGTIDGTTDLGSIRLFYDMDTTAPYDCVGETYAGTEPQFGATTTFSAANGTSTFSGSVGITTTATMCAYVLMDINESAVNGDTVDIRIDSPATDIIVSGAGSVAPSSLVDLTGSTTLSGALMTQTHYHWRNDDGTEASATSATGGNEDTPLVDFNLQSPIRLRLGISNEGATSSVPHTYNLEYGIKITTCSAVTVWTDVGATNDAWDMSPSSHFTQGDTTTNIAVINGGVTNENTSFVAANANMRELTSYSATTTFSNAQHSDIEYSITSTDTTVNDTNYCFRVTQNGTPLLAYAQYAELTTSPKRDFKIQQGTVDVTGTSTTLTAGVNYIAPSSSTTGFIRITNMYQTGAGLTAPGGGSQNADDYGAYIKNPENITTSITFARDNDSINDTRISWEIIEFVGASGTDNEMVVRDQGLISYGNTQNIATGTVVAGVLDDADIAVFITGQMHSGGNRIEGFAHQSTASWSSSTDEPVFERGANGNNQGFVSYAVLEFKGINWKVQRSEHQYTNAGSSETESITAVNSIARTFLHTQKRYTGGAGLDDFGHEVYLSSIGAITYYLQPTADTATFTHTSVAWVIENTQTSNGAMEVQRNNGGTTGGVEPVTINVTLSTPVDRMDNTSIFSMSRHNQTGSSFPRVLAGVTLISTTTYQIWRSEADNTMNYRTEIVQWPVANFAMRQNYYRFYVDDGNLDPLDPWPLGVADIGENTTLTSFDEPLGEGERIRMRMSVSVSNATMPAGLVSMKLQYGLRDTTCSAVSSWVDVGAIGGGAIWRGYNDPTITDGVNLATSTPAPGTLNLSVSDIAGSYIEENPSPANPYAVSETQDIEYDWIVEHNGANESSFYCFRMIQSDNTPLDGYIQYPQLRTAGFNPVTTNWRWYSDYTNETPTTALATENTAPNNIANTDGIALRIGVDELKNVTGNNIKFKLQFSEYADFSTSTDVVSSSTCTASDLWCYINGGGGDNTVITSSVLLNTDPCIAGVGNGCGTHNTSADLVSGYNHLAGATTEYSFTLQHAGARENAVYYFRLYDVTNDQPVPANGSYPSLQTEGAGLIFTISGVDAGTSIGNIITDATTTASSVSFNSVPIDTPYELAHQLTVDTNATQGYQIFVYSDQPLTDSYGSIIPPVVGSNATPTAWTIGCTASSTGCFGYHTTDNSLSGSVLRFAPDDTYASFSTSPQEIMYRSTPTNESHDIVYKLQVGNNQTAGEYKKSITYIAVPVF